MATLTKHKKATFGKFSNERCTASLGSFSQATWQKAVREAVKAALLSIMGAIKLIATDCNNDLKVSLRLLIYALCIVFHYRCVSR